MQLLRKREKKAKMFIFVSLNFGLTHPPSNRILTFDRKMINVRYRPFSFRTLHFVALLDNHKCIHRLHLCSAQMTLGIYIYWAVMIRLWLMLLTMSFEQIVAMLMNSFVYHNDMMCDFQMFALRNIVLLLVPKNPWPKHGKCSYLIFIAQIMSKKRDLFTYKEKTWHNFDIPDHAFVSRVVTAADFMNATMQNCGRWIVMFRWICRQSNDLWSWCITFDLIFVRLLINCIKIWNLHENTCCNWQ